MSGFDFEDMENKAEEQSLDGLDPLPWDTGRAISNHEDLQSLKTDVAASPAPKDEKAAKKEKDAEGKIITIADLRNMEEYIFDHCRNAIVAELNNALYEGELSRILQIPVLSQSIRRDCCRFMNYRFWRVNQTDFLADVDINLQELSVEGKESDFTSTFGIYVTLWFSANDDFDFCIQEINSISERPERDLVKLDQHLVPIMSRENVDDNGDEMWLRKVPDALCKSELRRAFILANAYNLDIVKLRLADCHDEDHVLFFKKGTVLVQDGPETGCKRLPPPRPVEIDANTIVLNTCYTSYDDSALAIYKACFEYDWYYCFFALNDCVNTRLDQFGMKTIVLRDKKHRPKDSLPFVTILARLGGFALMLPASIMKDRVWREYQRASMGRTTPDGYINHNGFRFAQAIRSISEDYQVARFRVRQRIVNMGHITAKGANNFDPDTNQYFTPFCFDTDDDVLDSGQRDANDNRLDTAFCINRHRLMRLYRDDAEFRTIMSTGAFAFVDGLVCLNDSDYIRHTENGYRLTPSANARVDLCCLRFDIEYDKGHSKYLYSAEGFNEKYSGLTGFHSTVTLDERSLYRKKLLADLPESFPEALRFLMTNRPDGRLNQSKLACRSGLKESTIEGYCNNPKQRYTFDEVVAICIGLNLQPWLSRVLLDKANFPTPDSEDLRHYGMILDCLYLDTIKVIQNFLLGGGKKTLKLDNFFF